MAQRRCSKHRITEAVQLLRSASLPNRLPQGHRMQSIKAIQKLWVAYQGWRSFRRSLEPLIEASDRELKDLGLCRHDLMYLRAGHRIERPPRGGPGRSSPWIH